MADESFIVEILKRIQADGAETRRRAESLDTRMAAMEEYMHGMLIALGGIQSDLTQANARIDRIERRLDLVSA